MKDCNSSWILEPFVLHVKDIFELSTSHRDKLHFSFDLLKYELIPFQRHLSIYVTPLCFEAQIL